MNILSVRGLTKIYNRGEETVEAVKDANFDIRAGEMLSIIGASGSGKTTLLNLIGCIDKPTKGIVKLNGTDVRTLTNKEIAKVRRQMIGFIFQNFNLIPILTAKENIIMPQLLDSKKIDDAKLNELSVFLGIKDRLSHLPSELSGGQRQRIAIARALINQPDIVLADEPTGNLDKKTGNEIMELLLQINKMGITVLLVTHDERYAGMCERTLIMEDGVLLLPQPNLAIS